MLVFVIRRRHQLKQEKTKQKHHLSHQLDLDIVLAAVSTSQLPHEIRSMFMVTREQQLSGVINYLLKFLPGLSDAMKPICRLTVKDRMEVGKWAINGLPEDKITGNRCPSVGILWSREPHVIQFDASQLGLWVCPLCYASRVLTLTEGRNAQIEK